MSETLNIEQKSGLGSKTTQIATQNNYYGLTPEQACQMAMKLFYENFPKLQEEAKALVEKRVAELMDEIAAQMYKKSITDMSPLADPDIQCAIYEAQKSYARLGTKEALSILATLVADRIKLNDNDLCLKVTIDTAIQTTAKLTSNQLDYLSLLFISTRLPFNPKLDITTLQTILLKLSQTFSAAKMSSFMYTNMLGCLHFNMLDVCKLLSERYNISVDVAKRICPPNMKQMSGDYTTSHLGTLLAITNIEAKTPYRFNLNAWIT